MSFKLSIGRSYVGNSGKSNFLSQLVEPLQSVYGVKIVEANEKSDIHLSIISGLKKSTLNVVRIDGVYYDKPRLKMNKPIAQTINGSDGVIFQSNWSRVFASNMLKIKPKMQTVIYNGVDQQRIRSVAPISKNGWDKAFVVSARWRPNKRLEAILDAFHILRKTVRDKKIGIFILGKSKIKSSDYVQAMGDVSLSTVFSTLRAADAMIHICHIDSCSNSVTEALSSGLPVVCNNIGGTPELVGNSGIIVDIDKPFKFKPIKSMSLVDSSSVNHKPIVSAMNRVLDWQTPVVRNDLDINVSAAKYYDFLRLILEKNNG